MAPSSPVTPAGGNHRTARLIAIIAGLVGASLAIATPLLPVTQTTAQLNWPQNGVLQSVDAPLIGYVATDLTITVPCRAAAPTTRTRFALRRMSTPTSPTCAATRSLWTRHCSRIRGSR